ncbi:MAG TPA: NUDIX hydrolase [Nitrospinaceae bacterium]|nr:NUDIX hydrolase [Nitrospinaceae bacterium]
MKIIFILFFFDNLDQKGQPTTKDYLTISPKIKTDKIVFGVGVLPVQENKFGLLKIFRHPIDQDNWELPGGFIEKGESPENAARRELLEEVGMLCKSKNLHSLGVIAPFPSTIGALIQVFIAFNCYPSEHPSNPELGHKEFKWFLMEKIEPLIDTEKIIDAVTLVALNRSRKPQKK